VVFPNTFLTWEEMFEFKPNVHQTDAVKESGLAMAMWSDPGTYEVGSTQHRNGQHIAGIIRIAQDPLNTVSGFMRRSTMPTACFTSPDRGIQLNDPRSPSTFRIGRSRRASSSPRGATAPGNRLIRVWK